MKKIYLCILILTSILHYAQSQYSDIHDFTKNNNLITMGDAILDNGILYGVANGGANNLGCIYKVNADGTGYTVLLDFNGAANGSYPNGPLAISGTVLYGMTNQGGANNAGCIYKINTDGTGYSKLLDFNTGNGAYPSGSLIISGTVLYGMTTSGGANNEGTIFSFNTSGSVYTKLHDFDYANNGEGRSPYGALTLNGTILYGTTVSGGVSDLGTLFAIQTNGSAFNLLHEFGGTDGQGPTGTLVYSGGVLYGTTQTGGANDLGVFFKYSGFLTKLYDFTTAGGGYPSFNQLCVSGSTFYGTTTTGGTYGCGSLFKINNDGSGYTALRHFNAVESGRGSLVLSGSTLYGTAFFQHITLNTFSSGLFKVNTDGSGYTKILICHSAPSGGFPNSALTASGNVVYGMTPLGGSVDGGCIFKMNYDGTGYTKLMDFTGLATGAIPFGSLTLSGNVLYGMTKYGGANDKGCIFKINTDGTGFVKLLDFDGTAKGQWPHGSLTLSGSILYGMTTYGGANNYGCIFQINTDGSGYLNLLDFSGTANGSWPYGSLVLSGGMLYGITSRGGAGNAGCIFKVNIDGSNYTKVLDYNGAGPSSNGYNPMGSPIVSGTALYALASQGGPNSLGTMIKINTSGSGYLKLYDFGVVSSPKGSLTIIGTTLYGLAYSGGANNRGVLYSINTDGTGFTKLSDLTTANGSYPTGDLTICKGLMGFTSRGGASDAGTIFRYIIAPTVQATNITVSNIQPNQVDVSFTAGDGEKRAVFVKQLTGAITDPVDNTTYTASSNWNSKGTQLAASGYYCVYNGTGNSVSLSNLSTNTQYSVQVYEYNGSAGGEKYLKATATNNPITFTTAKTPQTITFNALPAKQYGDAPFKITTASATSGLPLTYTSSDLSVATISNDSITILSAGNSTITAMQAGDANYQAAPNVSQTLTVSKGTQTITFNPLSPVAFSDSVITLTGTATSGLQVSYTSGNPSVATVSGDKMTLKGPGAADITASQAGDNRFNAAVSSTQTQYVTGLCVVMYDNATGKYKVVWEKPSITNIKQYKVYKETSTNVYDVIATVTPDVISQVIDSNSNPDAHADKYKISIVDNNDKESRKSYFHKTPHIIINGGNITWYTDNYTDESGLFVPDKYYIYRGSSKTNMTKLDSLSGSAQSYTDTHSPIGTVYYQIGIKKGMICTPTGILKAESGPYTQSLSNIAEFKANDLSAENEVSLTAFPNPFSSSLTIELTLENSCDVMIEVINLTGQKVAAFSYANLTSGYQKIQLDAASMNIEPGMCYLKVFAGGKCSILKCNYIK